MSSSRPVVTFSLLILCATLSLAGTDLILPAVPQLPAVFATNEATAQLVLAAYVGGSGFGLLLFGRLVDRFERKALLVSSLAAFAIAALGCAFSPSIGVLIGLRFAQGAASAAAPVFGPGIIRQLFSDKAAVRAVGFLGSVESLVPALAPILGVALLAHLGWQSSFELLAALASAAAVLIAMLGMPRTQRARGARGGYLQLLTDRVFMRYALSQAMTLGGLITFVFGAPAVIVGTMGGTLDDFIVMQVVNVAGFIVTANLSARIAERLGAEQVILLGTAMAAASALALLAYGLAGGADSMILTLLFLPMAIGLGLRGPVGFYRGVVAAGGNDARGSALIVFFIFMMTTMGTVLAAPIITRGLPALALVASAIHLASVASLLLLPRMQETVSQAADPQR
ncbi:multidrug effflux MFS transporter [Vineibacter terrae]|uniref:Multidrug effflux MFS transporter n=1 Tax=Vineibacter terrae TaxID=2586908 RepID=A0A5C8PT20_9HYPH|nr:MFS transporter [Vineibacter terrae]TXL79622.1 multidrug effflux MFS transporter [Vineibacter terrae]